MDIIWLYINIYIYIYLSAEGLLTNCRRSVTPDAPTHSFLFAQIPVF